MGKRVRLGRRRQSQLGWVSPPDYPEILPALWSASVPEPFRHRVHGAVAGRPVLDPGHPEALEYVYVPGRIRSRVGRGVLDIVVERPTTLVPRRCVVPVTAPAGVHN
jgi:hypothetical protein